MFKLFKLQKMVLFLIDLAAYMYIHVYGHTVRVSPLSACIHVAKSHQQGSTDL